MHKKDYYKILGLSKDASLLDIKKSYKKLAIKYHPDRNQGNKSYEEKFKEIKEAYEILSDDNKRSMYDQYGHSAFNNSSYDDNSFTSSFTSSGDFSDIFSDVFGDIFGTSKRKNKSSSYSKGTDINYNIILNLEDIIYGISKNISINVIQRCSLCNGTGCRTGYNKKVCNICKGSGNLKIKQGFFTVQQTCPNCNGECYIIDNPCYICKGEGIEKCLKNIIVKIPAGVNDGDKIRLAGKGNLSSFGKNPGDLYINIKLRKHSIFDREGNNLYCKVPINFTIAALGGIIEIPTLEGNVNLKIPPETQTGKIFRIKNKGIKSLKSNFKGDLLCKIFVETPVNLNKFQKKLLYNLDFSLSKNNKENNNPKSKNFFEKVKIFFKNFTR